MTNKLPSRISTWKKIELSAAALALLAGGVTNTIVSASQNPEPASASISQMAGTNSGFISFNPGKYTLKGPTKTYLPLIANNSELAKSEEKDDLEAIVGTENLLLNGSFTQGNKGWDVRNGLGYGGGNLGKITDGNFRSAPYSLFLPYSDVCDKTEGCTRAVWPIDAIPINEKTDIKEGDVLSFIGYVMLGQNNDDPSVYWVNPKYAGSLGPFEDADIKNYKQWMDRGGAMLGLDFYNENGEIISTVRGIADWTNDSYKWYEVDVCAKVVEGAKYAVPWVQVNEKDVPTNVWADDLSLTVTRFR